VLVVGGGLVPAAVPPLCDRVRTMLETDGAGLVICEVGAIERPDAVALDALARMQLTARRLGGGIRLRHASPALRDLLELTGLSGVVPASGLRRDLGRQAEQSEQLRVEEAVDGGDPPV
jgi:anti-anti-sigma regulatory factor